MGLYQGQTDHLCTAQVPVIGGAAAKQRAGDAGNLTDLIWPVLSPTSPPSHAAAGGYAGSRATRDRVKLFLDRRKSAHVPSSNMQVKTEVLVA